MPDCGASYHATLQPDVLAASGGETVKFVCSTNIGGARHPGGWVINGTEHDLRLNELPQMYTVNGLSIVFKQMFSIIIKCQCFFSYHSNGRDIYVYSNEAFLVPNDRSTRG